MRVAATLAFLLSIAACLGSPVTFADDATRTSTPAASEAAIVLVIDEESIDDGNPPNSFSGVDVNDQKAGVGVRDPLAYFAAHEGRTIDLFTGNVGDEGWHALKIIPASWKTAGPTDNGTRNYLLAGPGLALLDRISAVAPLRARGLAMLAGETICAVVYDGDVVISYEPLMGNLKGANLGIVAFEVLGVQQRFNAGTGALPRVTITILDAEEICGGRLVLFANAPTPRSSSQPYDVSPPAAAVPAQGRSAP